MTAEELYAKQSIREKLVNGSTSVQTDKDTVSVQSSMTGLTSITKKIDEISYDAAQLALTRGIDLLGMGVDVKLSPIYATSLFESLLDMSLIPSSSSSSSSSSRALYSKLIDKSSHNDIVYITHRRLTTSDSIIAALQTDASSKYGSIILQSMVSGQANIETIESSLRFTSSVPSKSTNTIGTYVNLTTPLTYIETIKGIVPFSVQLYISATNKNDVKLSTGIINEKGYGDIANEFSTSPMTLLIEDMSVCGTTGCKALVTLQNNNDIEYISQ
jgi:hypothetical protein